MGGRWGGKQCRFPHRQRVPLALHVRHLRHTVAARIVKFLSAFPCVCPEPVLAKRSFLCINGSKKTVFFSPAGLVDVVQNSSAALQLV